MSGWGNTDNDWNAVYRELSLRGTVLKYFGPKECNKLWKIDQVFRSLNFVKK